MGGSDSKMQTLNKQITKITTKALFKDITNCTSNISQTQTFYVSGNAKVNGFRMDQKATISITCLADQTVNNQMQQELKTKLNSYLTNKNTAALFGYTNTNTSVTNIIDTNVSNIFKMEKFKALNLSIFQNQDVKITDVAKVTDVHMTQTAELIGQMINHFTANISNKIRQNTDISNKSLAKTTSMMDSMLTGLNNILDTLFTWSSGTIIMAVGCCVCCIAMSYFSYKFIGGGSGSGGPHQKRGALMQIGSSFKQIGAGLPLPKSKLGKIFLILAGILLLIFVFFGYAYIKGHNIRKERRNKYIEVNECDPNLDDCKPVCDPWVASSDDNETCNKEVCPSYNKEVCPSKDLLSNKPEQLSNLSKRPLVTLPDDNIETIEARNRARKRGTLNGPIPPALPFSSKRIGYLPKNKTVTF